MSGITLEATTLPIRRLVDDVDRGHLKLPEIQRDYVWKAAQIAGLLDSLYREYPSGSLLLWETDDAVTERSIKIDPTGAGPAGRRILYLLDGQQRLTSLHRVFMAHDQAKVVFNFVTERFQIESAATSTDPRWVRVSDILSADDLYPFVDALAGQVGGISKGEVAGRLARLKAIGDYKYHVEVISDLPYEEVTEIFIRVNSRGRSLKATDLALAALSVRWHGVMAELEDERDLWADEDYPAMDLAFLARALAAVATESRLLSGFKDTSREDLMTGWLSVQRGLRHLIPLLKKNVGIDTSHLIPSSNALVPLVAFLGTRTDQPLSDDHANGIIYWLLGAFLTGRYNQAGDTKIAQDAKAVRDDRPIEALMANLGLLGTRLEVTDQSLLGKGAGSPYFLLSYLVAKRAGARDWFFGTQIGLDAEDAHAIEYHHVHPQATIKDTYSKSEINDLANLAFISSRANKRISARSPLAYFPEVGDVELSRHYVPLDGALRSSASYPAFVTERRRLLADAMTDYLETFRPGFLDDAAMTVTASNRLVVNLYTAASETEPAHIEFDATQGGTRWTGITTLAEFERFLSDVEAGLTGGLAVGGEEISVEGGGEVLEVPIGPFVVTGTSTEWRAMLERERENAPEGGSSPGMPSEPWTVERVPIGISEAE